VSLPGGRQAEWDTDGTAGLEAQVMRDGMLVGYVPQIEGSEDFSEPQIVDAIARTDYDSPSPASAPLRPRPVLPLPAKAACSAVSSTASATSNPDPPATYCSALTRQHEGKHPSMRVPPRIRYLPAPERAESGITGWFLGAHGRVIDPVAAA
jgi:hypothetical protein